MTKEALAELKKDPVAYAKHKEYHLQRQKEYMARLKEYPKKYEDTKNRQKKWAEANPNKVKKTRKKSYEKKKAEEARRRMNEDRIKQGLVPKGKGVDCKLKFLPDGCFNCPYEDCYDTQQNITYDAVVKAMKNTKLSEYEQSIAARREKLKR